MTAITIRQGRPGDAAAITRMVQQLAEATVAGFVPKLTPEIYRTEAFGPHPQLIVWIALDVDAPVGMLLGNPVTSSWRGKRGLYVGDL